MDGLLQFKTFRSFITARSTVQHVNEMAMRAGTNELPPMMFAISRNGNICSEPVGGSACKEDGSMDITDTIKKIFVNSTESNEALDTIVTVFPSEAIMVDGSDEEYRDKPFINIIHNREGYEDHLKKNMFVYFYMDEHNSKVIMQECKVNGDGWEWELPEVKDATKEECENLSPLWNWACIDIHNIMLKILAD